MKNKSCKACGSCSKITGKLCDRCYRIKYKFGVNPKDIHDYNLSCSSRCEICGREQRSDRSLAIDHDHFTDKVRGLLCTNCNIGLGNIRTIKDLESAIRYLTREYPSFRYYDKKVSYRHKPLYDQEELKRMLEDLPKGLSTRAKAKELYKTLGMSFEGALSRIKRFLKNNPIKLKEIEESVIECQTKTINVESELSAS